MEFLASFSDQDVAGHAETLDEAAADSEHRCGYGACSQCSCKSYMGSGDICGNCNHNYSFHW